MIVCLLISTFLNNSEHLTTSTEKEMIKKTYIKTIYKKLTFWEINQAS